MALVSESFWRRLRYTPLRDVFRGQLNGRLDWRSVIAEAGLPSEIADTIFQVVRKTRLWNGECVDVAQELVAHFQDGLEMGRSAEQVASEFGDVAQAAALIRRAKKRNRPLWWRALHACCWLLGCFFVVYVLLALYMLTERLTLDTDYLAVINRRADARAQGAPAWPLYRKAMLAIGWRNAQPPLMFQVNWYQAGIAALLDDSPGEGPDDGPTLREYLVEHQLHLAELREATTLPRLGFSIGQSYQPEDTELLGAPSVVITPDGEPPELISMLLGHVQVLNHAGILLACDALAAAESGDAQRAHENLTACLRVVRHVQDSPFLVSGLISLALEWTALDVTKDILRDHPQLFSDEQLAALAHRFEAIEPPMDYWLESERVMALDVIQRIYGNSGRVTHQGALYLGDLRQVVGITDGQVDERAEQAQQILVGIGLPAINQLVASRDEQLAMYNEIWQQEQSDCSKPLWQLSKKESRIDRLSNSQWEQIKYMPLVLLMPAIDAVHMSLERNAGRREGALIGIALEFYRREHGDWPKSLEQLSPQWLPEVPIDRINGGPLGYRTSVEGVVVYSFGTDTDDDQGRPTAKEAAQYHVFLPSPITEETSPSDVLKRDGDWVIWSTFKDDIDVQGE